eukprot:3904632-Pyramimonas_sp.AAC.1
MCASDSVGRRQRDPAGTDYSSPRGGRAGRPRGVGMVRGEPGAGLRQGADQRAPPLLAPDFGPGVDGFLRK